MNLIRRFRNSKNPVISSAYNFARQSFTGEWDKNGKWRYVSMAEFSGIVHKWIKELPVFDVVCAIPRSGLIPGAIIATELNTPLTTPDKLLSGDMWKRSGDNTAFNPDLSILLVDDSMGTGTSLTKYKSRLLMRYPNAIIITAVVFGWMESRNKVDLCCCPHSSNMRLMFEYNLTRLKYGELSCDMDGVICEDYTIALPKPEYVKWIENAKPYRIPTFRVKSIVTNREEKYRNITEHWLRKYNVVYDSLVMNSGEKDTALFKVNALLDNPPDYYWESDSVLSEGIFKATRIPTLCINTGQFFSEG